MFATIASLAFASNSELHVVENLMV